MELKSKTFVNKGLARPKTCPHVHKDFTIVYILLLKKKMAKWHSIMYDTYEPQRAEESLSCIQHTQELVQMCQNIFG